MATLKAIVSRPILTLITTKRTLDSCLDLIAATRYPISDKTKYDAELLNMEQANYYRIEHYSVALHDVFNKYCLCASIKPAEQIQREEEYFTRGLHPITKAEMAGRGKTSKESIIAAISAIEESLMRNAKAFQDKPAEAGADMPREKIKTISSAYNNKNNRVPTQALTRMEEKPVKYCKKHGNCFHDSKDCRQLKEDLNKKHSSELVLINLMH